MNTAHLSLHQVCRLCLLELNGSSFVPIFDNRDNNIPQKIKACFNINVSASNNYEKTISKSVGRDRRPKVYYQFCRGNACAAAAIVFRVTRCANEARGTRFLLIIPCDILFLRNYCKNNIPVSYTHLTLPTIYSV